MLASKRSMHISAIAMMLLSVAPYVHAKAICDGKTAVVDNWVCDGAPAGAIGKCTLLGIDKNADGKWDDGDEFAIIFEGGSETGMTYNKACFGSHCDHPDKVSCPGNSPPEK